MERLNLTLPKKYKELILEMAGEEGISASELIRQWISKRKEESKEKAR